MLLIKPPPILICEGEGSHGNTPVMISPDMLSLNKEKKRKSEKEKKRKREKRKRKKTKEEKVRKA